MMTRRRIECSNESIPTLSFEREDASQGDSRAAALANIREAIELYVEDCRDAGDPVPTGVGKEFVEVEAAQSQERSPWPSFLSTCPAEKWGPPPGKDRLLVLINVIVKMSIIN